MRSFVCFEGRPGGDTTFAVVARGAVDLTVDPASTPGWGRVAQVVAKKSTLQATTNFCTNAVFRNPSAGGSETLVVASNVDTTFTGVDLGRL